MLSIKVDAAGTFHALQKLAIDIEHAAERALTETIEAARRRAFDTTAFQDRTGELRSTLFTSENPNPAFKQALLVAASPHALYVEDGTKPHVISARRGGFLAFDMGGRRVFAKKVNHPGTKATHFLLNAVESEASPGRARLERETDTVIARFNG